MDNVSIGIIIVPGIFALLLFLVFSYLYAQGREPYFRAWQMAWAAYSLQYALLAWTYYGPGQTSVAFVLSSLLFVGVAAAIFVSTRLLEEDPRFHWSDVVLAAAALVLIVRPVTSKIGNKRAARDKTKTVAGVRGRDAGVGAHAGWAQAVLGRNLFSGLRR